MPTINQLSTFLESFAPLRLAEDWDNVGLLVGDRQSDAKKIMTCLTITPASAAEAIEREADIIVSHHPLPFRPLKRVTTDTIPGKLLFDLIRHNVAIYSSHTAFDSAATGINQQLAQSLSMAEVQPLIVAEGDDEGVGSGRFGTLPEDLTVQDVADRLKLFLSIDRIRCVGKVTHAASKAAIACGSGGTFLLAARRVGCDMLVTGEATFHTCLEAEAAGLSLLLVGHFASERFACEKLAEEIAGQFTDATVWASEREADPLTTI